MNTTEKKHTAAQRVAIESDAKHILCVAGPGSGKTTVLVERIRRIIAGGTPPSRIVAITFTNEAARNLEERIEKSCPNCQGVGWWTDGSEEEPRQVQCEMCSADIRLGFVGTLHSFALRMLKRHGAGMGYGDRVAIVGPEAAADLLASKAQQLGCKASLDDLLLLKGQGRPNGRLDVPKTCVAAYYDDLREAGLVDLDSLLPEFLRLIQSSEKATDRLKDWGQNHLSVPQIDLGFDHILWDEMQDSAEVDWRILHALPIANKFMVGDGDQCQPAGTMVRMADGFTAKPIEKLKVGDKVLSYDRHSKVITKNGVVSAIASRPYAGNIFAITADGGTTFCTPNHRWLIRWPSGKQRTSDSWCTYLMRKGDYFRVGKTRFFRGGSKTSFLIGLPLRMRQEKADSGWILKVHATEAEATSYEQVVAANYGLPETCFVSNGVNRQFTQEVIDSIFSRIPNQLVRAARCLQDHGRELQYPLFDKRQIRTRRTVQEIHACNLISDLMMVPVAPGIYHYRKRGSDWQVATVALHSFSGLVYSLDVTPTHKYIANGIVTCNSIYAFRGGRVDMMINESVAPGVEVIRLEENFRSYSEVCAAANNLIEHNADRIKKLTVSARGMGGGVALLKAALNEGEEIARVASKVKELLDTGTDPNEVAVLARTNALCASYAKTFAACEIPVRKRGEGTAPKDWPVARALVDLMVNPHSDTLAYFALVMLHVKEGKTPAMARNAAHHDRRCAEHAGVSLNQFKSIFEPGIEPGDAAMWLGRKGVSAEASMLVSERVRELGAGATMLDLALAMNRRDEAPEDEGDGVTICTVHNAKGREWDAVFLVGFEDESTPGRRKDANVDEERRLAYVGVTRARERVYVAHATMRAMTYGKFTKIEPRTPSRFIKEMGL